MTEHASRLAKLHVAELTVDQHRLYESIRGARTTEPQVFSLVDSAGRLEGPFNAMLLQPHVGSALQALGAAIRFGGALSDRAREISILIVAAVWTSEFEQYAHEAVGRAVGLSEDELSALRTFALDEFTDRGERMVAEVTIQLAREGDLSDGTYESAVRTLGTAAVFELTTLVGYYATIALQLRVFRVSRPCEQDLLDSRPLGDHDTVSE